MLRTALGGAIADWLADPAVIEIMLNPDGRLWVDRLGIGIADSGILLAAADGERIIRLVAHHVGAAVHAGSPRVSAELPESGERFEGLLPPVVAGVALLSAFGRHGLVGEPLRAAFGTQIPYTTVAVVLAHTFVALPFFVISTEGALRATSGRLEVAADDFQHRWRLPQRFLEEIILQAERATHVGVFPRAGRHRNFVVAARAADRRHGGLQQRRGRT